MTRLADVPTVVVSGARGAGKTRLLAQRLAGAPAGSRLAVLLAERGATALPQRENLIVAEATGCVCCVGQVSLRVALTRLLRDTRPEALYVELGEPAHLAQALRTLASPWLAPVVSIREVVGVADAAATARDGAVAAWLAQLTALYLRNDADGRFAAFAQSARPGLALH